MQYGTYTKLCSARGFSGFAKSKTSVSHSSATVVTASVSTERLESAVSSTLSRTGVPAAGEYTRTDMRVLFLTIPAALGSNKGH